MQQLLLVTRNGSTIHREAAPGFNEAAVHAIYSGTKSFWGVAALEAQADGLLDLEEPVRGGITVRMLLSLTAGYGFGGLGTAVPTFERAWEIVPKHPPGAQFTYGGIPLQVFGAFFAERLKSSGRMPYDYLRERVLAPAGVTIASWRTLQDGTQPLPTGASLDAQNWLAYGRFVLERRERYRDALTGSSVNPRYGLGWWLADAKMPPDTFYASGSGGQGLYVLPSRNLVAVRFGDGGSVNHPAMVKKLLAYEGTAP
jgi:CubicO group peptidase (beta-lactamase class C family)